LLLVIPRNQCKLYISSMSYRLAQTGHYIVVEKYLGKKRETHPKKSY
jgi:hypothetical protein